MTRGGVNGGAGGGAGGGALLGALVPAAPAAPLARSTSAPGGSGGGGGGGGGGVAQAEVEAMVLKLGRMREVAELRARGSTLLAAVGGVMATLKARHPYEGGGGGGGGEGEDVGVMLEGAGVAGAVDAAQSVADREREGLELALRDLQQACDVQRREAEEEERSRTPPLQVS